MDIAQFYEQHVVDCESGLAVRLIMIPRESLAPHARSGIFEWPALLGLREIARLTTPEEHVATVASLLRPGAVEARMFAATVLASPLVFAGPSFEIVTLDSLNAQLESQRAICTLMQLDGENACMATLPEGIILYGEARAVASALEVGLANRMREAMGLDGRATRPGLVG
jgi:hypothetical protein